LSLFKREIVGVVSGLILVVLLAVLVTIYGWIQLSEISSALAYALVTGIGGALLWGFKPRIMRSIKSVQTSGLVQTFQTFRGGDELLEELERLESSCGRIVQSLGVSGHDINRLIRELSQLRFTLVGLAGKYTGIWLVSLDKAVTMVADQLGQASSVLSEEPPDVELVKAHIDGAVRVAESLIVSLKSGQPPSS
jgi:hypothetical protein